MIGLQLVYYLYPYCKKYRGKKKVLLEGPSFKWPKSTKSSVNRESKYYSVYSA
jgi:hypothetical protein